MERSPIAMTIEQKILAALARIESKLDDTERRVKAVQQDLNRGQKNSTGLENFKLTHYPNAWLYEFRFSIVC